VEAHQIIDETMERGEAIELMKLTGKSDDLWNSYRRPPRCPENPFGTGNYSPVYYYLQFLRLRKAVNKAGAIRMHRLVTSEIEEDLTTSAGHEDLTLLSMNILDRTTEAVKQMNGARVTSSGYDELRELDATLGKLSSEVDIARASIRAEIRRREAGGKVFETV
jgi:hypothetical protein